MKVGDMGQSKSVLEAGEYTLRIAELKVKEGKDSGVPFVILDVEAVEGEEKGHTEVTFSFSQKSLSFAKAWLLATGCSESDDVPVEDAEDLEAFLKARMLGKYVKCTLEKVTDGGGYEKNNVSPPWEVEAAEAPEGYTSGVQEEPEW